MQGKTHLAFGMLIAALLTLVTHFNMLHKFLFFAMIVIGSVLPDIDTPKSYVGKRVKLNPAVLFGHRTLFHSFTIVVVLFIAFLFAKQARLLLGGLLIGYVSHLLLDALTLQGIVLFWPFKAKVRGSIATSSMIDHVLFYIFLITAFFILLR